MSMDYVAKAKKLFALAENIKEGKINFDQVPFNEIVLLIQRVYGGKTSNGDFFSLLYGRFIAKSLEFSDKALLVDIISLLAHHLMIFASDDSALNKEKNINLIYRDKSYIKQSQIGYRDNCKKIEKWYEHNPKENVIHFCGRGVIYSAVTGGYDDIKEPQYVNPNLDYVLFTDNPDIKSEIWDVRLIEQSKELDPVRMARRIKILGHEYLPEYDYSIWVDGKLGIIGDLEEYVQRYRSMEPILCFNHYVNDCIYEELDACASLNKDSLEVMQKQIDRYRSEGYPEHNGLIESAIIVRDIHNEKLQDVMGDWWSEVLHGSKRDQLSFNYACWKNDFMYDTSDLYIYSNKYVELYFHNNF